MPGLDRLTQGIRVLAATPHAGRRLVCARRRPPPARPRAPMEAAGGGGASPRRAPPFGRGGGRPRGTPALPFRPLHRADGLPVGSPPGAPPAGGGGHALTALCGRRGVGGGRGPQRGARRPHGWCPRAASHGRAGERCRACLLPSLAGLERLAKTVAGGLPVQGGNRGGSGSGSDQCGNGGHGGHGGAVDGGDGGDGDGGDGGRVKKQRQQRRRRRAWRRERWTAAVAVRQR